ncbi:hypothetical protein [Pseudalkalibacillus sp. SCS-8]|uniref:hypothetical protein n=1 Tax=Pseudalkalibacillus nanhaiensis TaxID=3115291 RepID=UPI0032DB3132
MKKYLIFVFFVLALEIGLLVGVSVFFNTNLYNTLFFGACFFIVVSLLFGTKGDSLTKISEAAVFGSLLGNYIPKHEKMTTSINPLLVGSLLCLVAYFATYYFGVLI